MATGSSVQAKRLLSLARSGGKGTWRHVHMFFWAGSLGFNLQHEGRTRMTTREVAPEIAKDCEWILCRCQPGVVGRFRAKDLRVSEFPCPKLPKEARGPEVLRQISHLWVLFVGVLAAIGILKTQRS